MPKKQYFIKRCLRLGEMPLFLIYYADRKGRGGQCVILCTFAKMKTLLQRKKGFSDPAQHGHVLFDSRRPDTSAIFEELLKSRYAIDLDESDIFEIKIN